MFMLIAVLSSSVFLLFLFKKCRKIVLRANVRAAYENKKQESKESVFIFMREQIYIFFIPIKTYFCCQTYLIFRFQLYSKCIQMCFISYTV